MFVIVDVTCGVITVIRRFYVCLSIFVWFLSHFLGQFLFLRFIFGSFVIEFDFLVFVITFDNIYHIII